MLFLSVFNLILILKYSFCETTSDPNCPTRNPDSKIRSSGTGTVLFNPTDVDKQCWSQDELALLTTRMIMEDVLPDPKSLSLDCNEDVEELIEYFKYMIESVRSCTKGRKRHIILLAITDLLGGFIHYAVLPLAKRGYYSGIIDYTEIEKIVQFYEEVKWFLRTNGQGWTKAMVIKKHTPATPINFKREIRDNHPPNANETCCQKLLYYEHEPLKSKKRAIAERGIYFPLPFFDAKHKPTAIVIPFKKNSLRNIESKRSAYLLMKYYLTAHRCLEEKKAKREMIEKFQNNLYAWIIKEVLPKLKDDKFYSAFGGVLRVETTLKGLGAKEGELPCGGDEGEEEIGAVPSVGISLKRTKVVLVAILLVIIFWFIVGSCFICYRMKSNRNSTDDTKKSKYMDSSGTFASFRTFWTKSSSKTSSQGSTCRCCDSTIISDFSENTHYTTSGEYNQNATKQKKLKKTSLFENTSKDVCTCKQNPAVIDTNHSTKILSSIAEISENSAAKYNREIARQISLSNNGVDASSSEAGSNGRPCAPPNKQNQKTRICPLYSEKSTSFSTINTTSYKDREQETQQNEFSIPTTLRHSKDLYSNNSTKKISSFEMLHQKSYEKRPKSSDSSRNSSIDISNQNRSNDQVDTTSYEKQYPDNVSHKSLNKSEPKKDNDILDYHMAAACHSSISGSYNLIKKKPYIFGYDFQTSTSSDLSDDGSDIKTNSTLIK